MISKKFVIGVMVLITIVSILVYFKIALNSYSKTEPVILGITSKNGMFKSEIIEAINCAREHKNLETIRIDEQLSEEAKSIKHIYASAPLSDQITLLEPYDWSLVSPLFLDQKSGTGCGWQDFDPITFNIDHITKVGIAIEEGYSVPSVLIIGKEE